MKFMGIPMDCNVETFSRRLVKEKGLVRGNFGDTDNPTLKGAFSGYQNCIFVLYGEEGGNIANIGVVMPMQEAFSNIKLMMASVDYTGGYLQLLYFDFKNAIIANDRALDDL